MIRQSVAIQQRPNTVDQFGAPSGVWETVFTLGARITPLSAQERVSANREIDSSIYQFVFPKGSNSITITTNHRILLDGREFDILSIEGISLRGREVTVMAQAVS